VLGPEAGLVGAADLAREEATWLRRVRVKTSAVTAKTAARSGRSARLERVARKSAGRRTGMRVPEPESLKEPTEFELKEPAELKGDTEA
jgi:hypothetical protein